MNKAMTQAQRALWERIQAFDIDDMGSKLKFSDRLARENGWSKEFTQRVIAEYKKFLFLCCVQPNGATPSDAVDQAWHLHMIYTRSYWDELCDNTLQRKLHHGPTRGGKSEGVKFDNMYTGTILAYTEFFNEQAPLDIWPPNEERFSDIDFQRVNMRRHWVIPKPSMLTQQMLAMIAICFTAMFCIQAVNVDILFAVVVSVVVIGVIVFFVLMNRAKKKVGGYTMNNDYRKTDYRATYTPPRPSISKKKKKDDDGSGCSSGFADSGSWWIFGSSGCSSSHSDDGGGSGCSSGCGGGCGGD